MSEQKWVRSSLRNLSARLRAAGHVASPPTVGRLLRGLDYALHVNAKRIEARGNHPDRAAQFAHIEEQRQVFAAKGAPIISVDSKKKELIGAFKNAGRAWSTAAEAVNVHDFPSDALGRAVPYGVYDLQHNRGTVFVGSSGDTAAFAVTAIAQWWQTDGQARFPDDRELLILADGGGSNDCRNRLWKQQLQEQLCDGLGLTVTVCHYPTGCSKWNPVEHRLFGPISVNWAGKPLRTFDTLLAYIRGTTTTTGLAVQAVRVDGDYPTGRSASDAEMDALRLTRHEVCSKWNYTISPQEAAATYRATAASNQELIA